MNYRKIGKENAIALYDSKWWEGKTDLEIAEFQLFTDELCMPFDKFHEAMEKALGRSIFTHEFGLNRDGLAEELLNGKAAPSLEEILNLLPEDKRIVIVEV